MSYDEATSRALHHLLTIDPNMIEPRAPKTSFWKVRRKIAFEKAKKRILEGMRGDKPAAINDVNDDSSEEEAASKHKMPLNSHSPTSPSLDLKPNYPPTIDSSTITSPSIINHQPPPSSPTLTDIKPAQSTDPLPSPSMSPTWDSGQFASDDDSLRSDDSIF